MARDINAKHANPLRPTAYAPWRPSPSDLTWPSVSQWFRAVEVLGQVQLRDPVICAWWDRHWKNPYRQTGLEEWQYRAAYVRGLVCRSQVALVCQPPSWISGMREDARLLVPVCARHREQVLGMLKDGILTPVSDGPITYQGITC